MKTYQNVSSYTLLILNKTIKPNEIFVVSDEDLQNPVAINQLHALASTGLIREIESMPSEESSENKKSKRKITEQTEQKESTESKQPEEK